MKRNSNNSSSTQALEKQNETYAYDFNSLEKKWQQKWEQEKLYQVSNQFSEQATEQNYYVLPQLPYPSGSGLHVGHAEVYTACDIYARYQRMRGKNVLQVIGWDAFGLPAENFAIKHNVHPRIKTNEAIDNFRYQIKRMGISVDWSREVGSHNPDYYKWTQWFFLLMYERGLAYRKKQIVNWCESCKTVLANEQVIKSGITNNEVRRMEETSVCERCDTEIELREMEQWYLKITEYADRLYDDLDKVDWPPETVINQRNWIGRSTGVELEFIIKAENGETHKVTCFTTAHDTIYGVTFFVLAPEHPLIQDNKLRIKNYKEVQKYINQAKAKTDLERQKDEKKKTGILLDGVKAINQLNGDVVDVFVADYVLMSYGTGAVMGVPGHDVRDNEFAKKYKLPIKYVVRPCAKSEGANVRDDGFWNYAEIKTTYKNESELFDSGFLSGLNSKEAKIKLEEEIENKGIGKRKINFRLRDWSVSRQRFWGAPVPMVFDNQGDVRPAKFEDLPIELPDDVDFVPTGRSPLTYSDKFQEGVEEEYGKGWYREVDTLDTFMCSSWYYYRYIDPHNDKQFASPEALKAWMPVDFYIGGPEHTNGHLLYSRFFTKVLYDAGYIDFDEPFQVHRHQGLILGEDNRKMSKRWGNVINPTDVIERNGADALRMYEMFMGPLSETKAWSLDGEKGIFRFLNKVWKLYKNNDLRIKDKVTSEQLQRKLHQTIKKVTEDIQELKFNTAIATMMELVNDWRQDEEYLSPEDALKFLIILAPFAPHITEEIYQSKFIVETDKFSSVHQQSWPEFDPELIKEDEFEIPVQVNGKLRFTVLVEREDAKDKQQIEALVLGDSKLSKWIKGKEIKKVVFVPGRLVNVVI